MKLTRSLVALGAVAALTLGMPTAAHAGGPGKDHGTQQHKTAKAAKAARAEAAAKKAEQARAERTRRHTAVPGTVTAVGAGTLSVARRQHGATVTRHLVVAPDAVVKLAGRRVTLAAVQVGDRVVAHVRSVGGVQQVVKLNVERRTVGPAPVVPATPTATILI